MPKFQSKKRNGTAQTSPYSQAAAKTKAANNVFKMNTDMGQHVLKNPGVAQAIVDKADLKQSDVRQVFWGWSENTTLLTLSGDCTRSRPRYWKSDCKDS